MLEHEASPTLSDEYKVRLVLPNLLGHFYEERVWVSLHDVGVPVSVVLVSNNNYTLHKVLRGVSGMTIIVYSLELFCVWLHDLWPGLAVIKMDAVNVSL